jgi:hypothetical protein
MQNLKKLMAIYLIKMQNLKKRIVIYVLVVQNRSISAEHFYKSSW